MVNDLQQYRQHLVLAEQKAQDDFDKTVLALSGGALGISFAFLDKIVGGNPLIYGGLLFLAWLSWGFSVASVLISYFVSHRALRRAILDVDKGQVYIRRPGGFFAVATEIFNVLGGILFVAGVILMAFFVRYNLEG